MKPLEDIKQRLEAEMKQRRRHSAHKEGDVLYYHDKYMNAYRDGVVLQVIRHTPLMTYYVLEVEVPIVWDSFLKLVSEFNVKTKEEL